MDPVDSFGSPSQILHDSESGFTKDEIAEDSLGLEGLFYRVTDDGDDASAMLPFLGEQLAGKPYETLLPPTEFGLVRRQDFGVTMNDHLGTSSRLPYPSLTWDRHEWDRLEQSSSVQVETPTTPKCDSSLSNYELDFPEDYRDWDNNSHLSGSHPPAQPSPAERRAQDSAQTGAQGYICTFVGCRAPPFQTQYLLNSHVNVHSSARPHYCPVPGCPRAEGGKGFKRKNEMIRHGLVHDSPGYVCPFCPEKEHKYPRPDNLQRHVRVHHIDKDKDDPALRKVFSQRPDEPNRGRRRRVRAKEPGKSDSKTTSGIVLNESPPCLSAGDPGGSDSEAILSNHRPLRDASLRVEGRIASSPSPPPASPVTPTLAPTRLQGEVQPEPSRQTFTHFQPPQKAIPPTAPEPIAFDNPANPLGSLNNGLAEMFVNKSLPRPLSAKGEWQSTLGGGPFTFGSEPDRQSDRPDDADTINPGLIVTNDATLVRGNSALSGLSRHYLGYQEASNGPKPDDQYAAFTRSTGLTAHFACQKITIGNWASIEAVQAGQQSPDLVIGYSRERSTMIYYIREADSMYKIEYPFEYIESISLLNANQYRVNAKELPSKDERAVLSIELLHPPTTFVKTSTGKLTFHGFSPCTDFTWGMRHHELSQTLTHLLEGELDTFRANLETLFSFESYINRHKFCEVGEENGLCASKDEIFTDSGYASMSNNRSIPCDQAHDLKSLEDVPGTKSSLNDDEADETKTIFSATTTINLPFIQESIDWVCDDIYGNVKQSVDLAGYESLSSRLPGLLKAFAIKLGVDASDPLSLRIMHFIYKHHEEIISKLSGRFDPCADDQSGFRKDGSPDMSVLEKMQLWKGIQEHMGVEVGSDELNDVNILNTELECIEEDGAQEQKEDGDQLEDEDEEQQTTPINLPSYNKVILESNAYQWLLSALTKQSSAYWGASHLNVMVNEIQSKILQGLPTGTISQKRPPRTFEVHFKILWEPMEARFREERAKGRTKLGSFSLANMMTLTGPSDDELQATTVELYLQQTWPDGGGEILGPLQMLLDQDGSGFPLSSTSTNNIASQFSLDSPYLVVTISGPAYFIAQTGEQLAWLASVVQPLSHEAAIYTPRIEETNQFEFTIDATPKPCLGATGLHMLLGKPLQLFNARLPPSCTARGFPIARRPEGFRGLEVPWYDLLTIAQSPTLISTTDNRYGGRLLQGTYAALELVQITNSVSLWHIADANLKGCFCSNSQLRRARLGIIQTVTFEELALYRHIIDACERAEATPSQDTRITPHSIETLSSGLEDQEPKTFSQYSPGSSHEYLLDCSPQNDSIDTDVLSISSVSQDAEMSPLGSNNKFEPIIEAVRDGLFVSFRACTKSAPGTTDGETTSNTASASSTSSATMQPPTAACNTRAVFPRKRTRFERDNDEDDGDGLQKRPVKKLKQQEEVSQNIFACPFWKYNPSHYRSCFRLTLRGVSPVKQHLFRKHVPEFYCQRCLVTFKEEKDYESHVLHPLGSLCIPDPSTRLDGILPQQQRQLSRKSKYPTFSEVEKWFTIWDIVFPSIPRPSSPYLDAQLTEDCASFQEHSLNHGPAIVAQKIEASGVFSITELTHEARREILLRAISAGLATIASTWTRPPQRASNLASRPPLFSRAYDDSSNIDSVSDITPANSMPDSGILMISQDSGNSLPESCRPPDRVPATHEEAFAQNPTTGVEFSETSVAVASGLIQHDQPSTLLLPLNVSNPDLSLQEWHRGSLMDAPSQSQSIGDDIGIGLDLESFDFSGPHMPSWGSTEQFWASQDAE